jgi:hypothetical protein
MKGGRVSQSLLAKKVGSSSYGLSLVLLVPLFTQTSNNPNNQGLTLVVWVLLNVWINGTKWDVVV